MRRGAARAFTAMQLLYLFSVIFRRVRCDICGRRVSAWTFTSHALGDVALYARAQADVVRAMQGQR